MWSSRTSCTLRWALWVKKMRRWGECREAEARDRAGV
jgi:hypothetical protein